MTTDNKTSRLLPVSTAASLAFLKHRSKQATSKQSRCWEGYEPVPGKEPYTDGSCQPKDKKKKSKKKSKKKESADSGQKLYYFKGRNTGVVASSAAEARKKCRRGCEGEPTVRTPTASEKKTMSKGRWVRTRRDGKSPEKSSHGKGQGYGPPRSKKSADRQRFDRLLIQYFGR